MRERLIAYAIVSPILQTAVGNRKGRAASRDRRPRPDGPVRIVVSDLFVMNGTVRAAVTLAGQLVGRHDVELVSLMRGPGETYFDLPPDVRVRVLDDRRPGARRGLAQRLLSRLPSVVLHPDDFAQQWYTLWSDVALLRALRNWRAGVVISTRAPFNLCAARFGRRGAIVLGQDHRSLDIYTDDLRREMRRHYGGLDALAVLTASDVDGYRRLMAGARTRIELIPNAIAPMPGEPREPRDKLIIAAGRVTTAKGFDLLVEAFVPVVERHPDWRLRIYAPSGDLPRLERMASGHGLEESVELKPQTPSLGEAMASAAVYALSSRNEGFPLVLIEAMSKGMAVVSFDCPTGPAEIITDRRDGLLVPPQDVPAFSAALLRVIEDEPLRQRLGAAAMETAREYHTDAIGERWEALLESHGAVGRRQAVR